MVFLALLRCILQRSHLLVLHMHIEDPVHFLYKIALQKEDIAVVDL